MMASCTEVWMKLLRCSAPLRNQGTSIHFSVRTERFGLRLRFILPTDFLRWQSSGSEAVNWQARVWAECLLAAGASEKIVGDGISRTIVVDCAAGHAVFRAGFGGIS